MSDIKNDMGMTVEFLPDGVKIDAIEGETIMQAARRAGVMIDAPCGEHGRCGKCRVTVVEGETDEPSVTEMEKLTPADFAAGTRLSCLAKVQGSLIVEVPNTSRHDTRRKATTALPYHINPDSYTKKTLVYLSVPSISGDLRSDLSRLRDSVPFVKEIDLSAMQCLYNVIASGNRTITAVTAGNRLIGVESGDTVAVHYGVAIDVGTTTVAGYMVNLATGREVAAASTPNPQSAFGADVISRIEYAGTQCDKVEELREVVTSSINEMLYTMAETADISICDIYEITMVGNTCMTHLFLGVDPHSLGQSPYVPVFTESMTVPAEELEICIQSRGVVRTLPNISGFVGADAVGVLAASNIKARPGLQVAVDIGTNAEVVASYNGRAVACSAAAGPAFE
ncbi:MAG: 2Fe-2S iron-sulfur cluster-binding protein, partial [bacterium]